MSAIKGTFEWMFFLPMLVVFAFFAFFTIRSLRVVFTYEKAVGTATLPESFQAPQLGRDFEALDTVSGDRVYFVVNNTPYIATSRTRTSNNLNLKEGKTITVYYHPKNPKDNRLALFRDLWLAPLILGVIWFIFFTIWFGTLMGPTAAGTMEEIGKGARTRKTNA